MVRKLSLMAMTIAAMIAISACSSGPQTTSKGAGDATQEPPKPAAAVTARSAYFQMYKPAREWAPDLLALTLKSGEVPNVNNEEGRAGVWTAVFVSPSRKEARTFSFAVADSGSDIHKGLNVSDKQIWGGVDAIKAHAPPIVDNREGDAKLLNGPKLDGDIGHASQDDIDAMFN